MGVLLRASHGSRRMAGGAREGHVVACALVV